MSRKERLSVRVDVDVVRSGKEAVARGMAENLSAWVNAALHRQVEHDQRLRAMAGS